MTTRTNRELVEGTSQDSPAGVRHFGSSVYGGRPTFALTRRNSTDGGMLTLYELLPEDQAVTRRNRLERVHRSVVIKPIDEALVDESVSERERWDWEGWVALKVTRLSGNRLRAVLPLLRESFDATELNDAVLGSTGDGDVFLPETIGVRLSLAFSGIKPIQRVDRMRAFARGVGRMSDEECYYWYAKCRSPSSRNGEKALRVLLTEHID